MHLHQLDALRLHQWKLRDLEERGHDNLATALGGKKDIFSERIGTRKGRGI
jgi:hypothetical protein